MLPDNEEEAPVDISSQLLIEQAKVGQAKWKAIQKGLELTEQAGEFVGKVLGPAAEAAGGIFGDQLRTWRAMNLNRLAGKWEEHLRRRGINPSSVKALPFGEAYRALEAASMEEDENVQDLWARLIASAMDPNGSTTVKKVYVDLLKSLGPVEAAFLDLVWFARTKCRALTIAEVEAVRNKFEEQAESTWKRFPLQERKTAIQNLVRLRCLAYNPRPPHMGNLFRAEHRQGGSHVEIDPQQFKRLMEHYEDLVMVSTGLREGKIGEKTTRWGLNRFGLDYDHPELRFILSPIGRDLMQACNSPDEAVLEGDRP